MVAKVGMNVYVIVGDEDFQIHGTITNVEPLVVEETNEVLSEYFPTITLDDGRVVNGLECWWVEVDD